MAYIPYFQRMPGTTKAKPLSKSPIQTQFSRTPVNIPERESFFQGAVKPATTRSITPVALRLPWNKQSDSKSKIRLFVRQRPMLATESNQECVRILNEKTIRVEYQYQQTNFRFDNILLPSCSQDEVFGKVKDLIHEFLNGVSATIFAYGQTGAGKTYTIIGDEQRIEDRLKKGIIPRALSEVLKYVQEGQKFQHLKLGISFFQVYNDKIYDLFAYKQGGKAQPSLDIKQDRDGYFSIPGLNELIISNEREAFEYLDLGLRKRSVGQTAFNTKSSRSHCVFSINLYKTHKLNGSQGVSKVSERIIEQLRIVDLAGSEKFKIRNELTPADREQHITELTSINKSLSVLGQCISALADAQRTHIPFRNSKLTRVLANSLNGKSKIALFVNICASIDSHRETISTLMFADRAKKAILDSRFLQKKQEERATKTSYSHSPIPAGEELLNQESMSLRTVIKAYCQERETRLELERFIRENNKADIQRELNQLKDQNLLLMKELNELKVQLPLKNKRLYDNSPSPFKSPEMQAHHRPADFPPKPVSILKQTPKHSTPSPVRSFYVQELERSGLRKPKRLDNPTPLRQSTRSRSVSQNDPNIQKVQPALTNAHLHSAKKPQSILKKEKGQKTLPGTPNFEMMYYSSNQETRKDYEGDEYPRNTLTDFFEKSYQSPQQQAVKVKKRVRFADKIENESELDDSMLERMHHNQKYNDDTIFEHMAIFKNIEADSAPDPKTKEFLKNRSNDRRKEGLFLKQEFRDENEEEEEVKQTPPKASSIIKVFDKIDDSRLKSFWKIPTKLTMKKFMKKPQLQVNEVQAQEPKEVEIEIQEESEQRVLSSLLRTTSLNMLPPLEELKEESEYNSQPVRQPGFNLAQGISNSSLESRQARVTIERPLNPIPSALDEEEEKIQDEQAIRTEDQGNESGGSGEHPLYLEESGTNADFNQILGDTGNEYNSNNGAGPLRIEPISSNGLGIETSERDVNTNNNTLTLGSISLEGHQMGCDPHFGSFINSNEASIIAPIEEAIRVGVQPQRPVQSSVADERVMASLTNTFSTVESLKEEVKQLQSQLAALRSGVLSHIEEEKREEPAPSDPPSALKGLEEQFSEIGVVQREASEEPSFSQVFNSSHDNKLQQSSQKTDDNKMEAFFSKITEEIGSLKSLVLNSSIVHPQPGEEQGPSIISDSSKEAKAESVLNMISDLKEAMKMAFAHQNSSHNSSTQQRQSNESKIFQIVDNLAENISQTLTIRRNSDSGRSSQLKKFIAPSSTGGFH